MKVWTVVDSHRSSTLMLSGNVDQAAPGYLKNGPRDTILIKCFVIHSLELALYLMETKFEIFVCYNTAFGGMKVLLLK